MIYLPQEFAKPKNAKYPILRWHRIWTLNIYISTPKAPRSTNEEYCILIPDLNIMDFVPDGLCNVTSMFFLHVKLNFITSTTCSKYLISLQRRLLCKSISFVNVSIPSILEIYTNVRKYVAANVFEKRKFHSYLHYLVS